MAAAAVAARSYYSCLGRLIGLKLQLFGSFVRPGWRHDGPIGGVPLIGRWVGSCECAWWRGVVVLALC